MVKRNRNVANTRNGFDDIFCVLQSLFMSTDGGQAGPSPGAAHGLLHGQDTEEAAAAASTRQEEEEGGSWEGGGRDCVVCQSAAVSVVLLPCRHACVCNSCAAYFQSCPICRAAVLESFTLTGNQQSRWDHMTC